MILPFGKYKGQSIKQIPDDYLMILAEGFHFPSEPGKEKFQVSLEIRIATRNELKARKYKKIGARWEKDEYFS